MHFVKKLYLCKNSGLLNYNNGAIKSNSKNYNYVRNFF